MAGPSGGPVDTRGQSPQKAGMAWETPPDGWFSSRPSEERLMPRGRGTVPSMPGTARRKSRGHRGQGQTAPPGFLSPSLIRVDREEPARRLGASAPGSRSPDGIFAPKPLFQSPGPTPIHCWKTTCGERGQCPCPGDPSRSVMSGPHLAPALKGCRHKQGASSHGGELHRSMDRPRHRQNDGGDRCQRPAPRARSKRRPARR